MARQDAFRQGHRLRVSERQAPGQQASVRVHHGAEVPEAGGCESGMIKEAEKVRFGFHNFRHALAAALVKLKVDAKTVQGTLRHEDFGTTMQLYAQSDMESMREAQGKFPEQLLGAGCTCS